MMKRTAVLILLSAVGTVLFVVRPARQESLAMRIDDYVRLQLETRHIASASVAVIHGTQVLLQKGYGQANIERRTAASPETTYQIGSLTKPFTAMAILLLVQDVKLRLDDAVGQYLPKLPLVCRALTVRQLLVHTSGINRDLRADNVDDFSQEEFWRRLNKKPLTSSPGDKWEYSNTGYIVLGMLIESISGQSYGEFLRRRVLAPLGMSQTSYLAPLIEAGRRAVGYEWGNDEVFHRSPYFSGGYAAGGLVSSVADLVKWQQALVTETILKRAVIDQMWKPGRLGNGNPVQFSFRGESSSYGFGWFLTSYRGRKLITHGGTVSGFSSILHFYPTDRLTIIVLCNGKSGDSRTGHAEAIAQGISDAYFMTAGD